MEHRRRVLRLYKEILSLHNLLPPSMRLLGNAYVRDEFRRHKAASPEFVPAFMKEWEQYRAMFQEKHSMKASSFGQAMKSQELQHLDEAQQEQLQELRKSAQDVGSLLRRQPEKQD